MKKVDPVVRRETIYIAVSMLALSVIMELVFLLLGYFDYTVPLGNLLGGGIGVLNFFLMGLGIQSAVGLDEKAAREKVKFSMTMRYLMIVAAAAIGINPTKYKVIAVVISAVIAGMVGFFYVSYIRYIDPDIMIQSKSTEIVLPAVVGGAAYIEGPLIGGLIMIPLSELLRANFAAILPGINMLMYAIVLIVVIRFRPSGILGWYMNSKCKSFIDEKILKKPSLDVLEEYELMADKGGK